MNEIHKGALCAFLAYLIWGISPIYFKALKAVSPVEIICHRVMWSVLFLVLLLFFERRGTHIMELLRQRRIILRLVLTSVLVGSNWLAYIWAINNNHMMEASLGYYINPLVNVLLGMLFLRERLTPLQWAAVSLAASGVGIQILKFGSVPALGLFLAFSFGTYGLLRKKLHVDSQMGLLVETLILLPVAAIYLFGYAHSATSDLSRNALSLNLLLMAAGPVTAVPLLLFAAAANRLRLSTLGFFQYIAPSLMFLLALCYGEQFHLENGITFAFIWTALGLFTLDAMRRSMGKTLHPRKSRVK